MLFNIYINIFNSLSASSTSDAIVPETEKLFMEGKIVQKLECRPHGKVR
jgi:transcription initiation factor TFIIF subunit beta